MPPESLEMCLSCPFLHPRPPLLALQPCLFDLVQEGFVADLEFLSGSLPVPMRTFERFRNHVALGPPRSRARRHFQRKTSRLLRKSRFQLWHLPKLFNGLAGITKHCNLSREILQLADIPWPVMCPK